jgi:BlaI family transcriptional regulator, penicillinase repressor
MKPPAPLTDVELEIMQVLWDLEQGTVREVYEVLRQRRQVAYTTVMTMMGILEEKGHVKRRKEGRAFLYTPARPRQKVIASMVDEFVGRVFGGSAKPLVLGLAKDKKLSAEDLREIERMLKDTP